MFVLGVVSGCIFGFIMGYGICRQRCPNNDPGPGDEDFFYKEHKR